MNYFILTGKIIQKPRKILKNGQYSTKILIKVPNYKKFAFKSFITIIAKGILGTKIFELYILGDYVIAEGHLSIEYENNNNNKKEPSLVIKLKQLHPAHLICK